MAPPNPPPALDGLSLEARRDFRCFNTDVVFQLADWRWSHLIPSVEAFFHRFERRFSRFLPDSELSRLNRRESRVAAVSDDMLALLGECLRLNRETGGVFNPLVLDNLEAAGYDASFERLTSGTSRPAPAPPDLSCVRVDARNGAAGLPLGLRIDLGGIGKGYAVDIAGALLDEAEDFLIDAGGDVYASGRAPGGGHWRVDVADPAAAEERLDVVAISNQAIATSWTTRRRWQTQDGWAHHIIDPRTGAPAASGLVAATVIAPRATDADVFAKTAVILGPERGLALLQERGLQGLLVLDDGSSRTTTDWPSA